MNPQINEQQCEVQEHDEEETNQREKTTQQ
jgi:hypothetical protein